jgi:hypothetical protein
MGALLIGLAKRKVWSRWGLQRVEKFVWWW